MIHRLLLAASFCVCLLPLNAFCEAEVVDDSENYALLEEQQAAHESPVARYNSDDYNEQSPLARDDSETTPNKSTNDVGLLDKVQGLQQEIQELRGQLEIQAHDLKLLQEQQLSFYKDLDARISNSPIKSTTATPPPAALSMGAPSTQPASNPTIIPVTPPVQPIIHADRTNPADEQISYLAAYELIKNKQFDSALSAMQAFVNKYPHGGYTANAQYWLGELYMVKNDYPQAITHFNVVLQEFPSSSKNAASLLKVGYALAASGRTAEAREKLQAVIKNYPDTTTARLAITKLESLNNQ